VRTRTAAHTQSAFAKQHLGLNTVVSAESGIRTKVYVPIPGDGQVVADLVTIGAQVASAAIKGTTCHLHRHGLFISGQGEVSLCVGGVDVMAGTAVERRDVGHAFNRRVMRGQAGIDTRLGTFSAMTASATGLFASLEGFASPMHGILSELRFFGDDQGGFIVAFGAGQVCSWN
jgi:hypothetical protein